MIVYVCAFVCVCDMYVIFILCVEYWLAKLSRVRLRHDYSLLYYIFIFQYTYYSYLFLVSNRPTQHECTF